MDNARKQELICSDCGQYESECKCGLMGGCPECRLSPPPVVGDLRELIAEVIYGKAIPKEVDWEEYDSYSEWKRKIRFTYDKADSILSIIKEAGFVKLAKGDRVICEGAWKLLSPVITKGIEVTMIEAGYRKTIK